MIPWFGKLPSNFEAWQQTVFANRDIDFYLFTDCDVESKSNLIVKKIEFNELVVMISKLFNEPITCGLPFKLCDYRPSFGLLFKDILLNYDFWGHCDMDMYYGSIRSFIDDNILASNEKIFTNGFLSLYRNNVKMNTLFLNDGEYPEFNFKEASSTNFPCYFDEYSGMGLKCIRNNIKVYPNKRFLDLSVSDNMFHNKEGKQIVCLLDNGRLYEVTAEGERKEIIFVHIQKRDMKVEGELGNRFVIAPGRIFATNKDFDSAWFEINQGKNYKRKYWWNRLKKIVKDRSVIWRIKKYFRVKKQFKYEQVIRAKQTKL